MKVFALGIKKYTVFIKKDILPLDRQHLYIFTILFYQIVLYENSVASKQNSSFQSRIFTFRAGSCAIDFQTKSVLFGTK